jgi:hypothetical protein
MKVARPWTYSVHSDYQIVRLAAIIGTVLPDATSFMVL